jgi:serine protease Do
VSECAPGSTADVQVIRNGETKSFTVKLGTLPGSFGSNTGSENNNSTSSTLDALSGVTVDNVTSDVRQQLHVPDNIQGAIVVSVDEDSNAAEAGLQPNDIIVGINRQPVTSADDAVKLCNDAKGDHILLEVWRRVGGMAMTTFLSVDNTKQQQ